MKTTPLYKTVDEYIALQSTDHQVYLETIRQIIKTTVPDAVEVLSYQMPAYKYHGMLCFFAVFKDHYSLFVSPAIREAFASELKPYKTTKSAIHFPFSNPIPVKLIEEIVRFAAVINKEKEEEKKKTKKRSTSRNP